MKNTREFITLVNGMKHEALVRMFPVSECAFRRTQSRETLVVQVIRLAELSTGSRWWPLPVSWQPG